MFTGIIEEIGNVREIVHGSLSIWLVVGCSKILDGMKAGDSIAVNGICLTVTGYADGWFSAAVMPETMRRTGLGGLKRSDEVNLERALKLSDRLGGHIVSGHIDGTGTVSERTREDNAIWLSVKAPAPIMKYIVMKGSVALDGTSLTVASVGEGFFKVSLIPLTSGCTTLGLKKAGDSINIECDLIGKYVERLLGNVPGGDKSGKGISMDLLQRNGFV